MKISNCSSPYLSSYLVSSGFKLFSHSLADIEDPACPYRGEFSFIEILLQSKAMKILCRYLSNCFWCETAHLLLGLIIDSACYQLKEIKTVISKVQLYSLVNGCILIRSFIHFPKIGHFYQVLTVSSVGRDTIWYNLYTPTLKILPLLKDCGENIIPIACDEGRSVHINCRKNVWTL